jgi:hypothetical protein
MLSGNYAYPYLDSRFLTSHFNILRRHIVLVITGIVGLNGFVFGKLLVDVGVLPRKLMKGMLR